MTPTIRYTPEQYAEVQQRLHLAELRDTLCDDKADIGAESELQKKIVADAAANGWPYLSFPQSKKVRFFLPPGWPDILIAMPKARTVFIETKSATGELGEKQRLMCNMFRMLGHEYYQCKSFKRYLEIKGKS